MARRQAAEDARMTDAPTLAGATHGTPSRLLIHTIADDDNGRWTLPVLWRRAWAWVRGVPGHGADPPTLEIFDLPGHRLLSLTPAGAVVDLVLPAGTYHVTTQHGESRRSYTVVLEQDATTELRLLPTSHLRRQWLGA
jgi:hypothetical protein